MTYVSDIVRGGVNANIPLTSAEYFMFHVLQEISKKFLKIPKTSEQIQSIMICFSVEYTFLHNGKVLSVCLSTSSQTIYLLTTSEAVLFKGRGVCIKQENYNQFFKL